MASSLEVADRFYRQGSYAHAAEQYASLLQSGQVPPQQLPEVRMRLCECYDRAERWDPALEAGLAFVREHRGTPWELRGLRTSTGWLSKGALLLSKPRGTPFAGCPTDRA